MFNSEIFILELRSSIACIELYISFALGGGYQTMPRLTLEADFTNVDEDNDWFMISARYQIK
ncbi:hypothetical protein [Granulosicoccus antarcticus]|uniref:hypothetical protein n=1 Tax=Granulosicoccus antarcticus TaxID=437505 RepID=UPI000B5A87B5|nr:hypothetical protein [Granulosicoccus antarcticus]